jgi:ubiquinone/menaquinone biosynthesis C-methylase UbiE
LPFRDKQYDMVSAFDMLEHLREDDVPIVLREFARVSRRLVFSICYRPSRINVNGETLHPCVRPEAWWVERIAEAGGGARRIGIYLVGDWV